VERIEKLASKQRSISLCTFHRVREAGERPHRSPRAAL
jgi:hypothetical protein